MKTGKKSQSLTHPMRIILILILRSPRFHKTREFPNKPAISALVSGFPAYGQKMWKHKGNLKIRFLLSCFPHKKNTIRNPGEQEKRGDLTRASPLRLNLSCSLRSFAAKNSGTLSILSKSQSQPSLSFEDTLRENVLVAASFP
jgi:hypothetical protein